MWEGIEWGGLGYYIGDGMGVRVWGGEGVRVGMGGC